MKQEKLEIFKDIPEYEEIYQISNIGNVKSLKYGKERILKPGIDYQGYLNVVLCKNKKKKTYKVHKLVSITFLNHKPDGYNIVVDHIDNNKLNNRLENLQLISHRENASKDKVGKTSKFTGVYWMKSNSKWASLIYINNKDVYLGLFDNELDASQIYQLALNNINIYNNNSKEFRKFLKTQLL